MHGMHVRDAYVMLYECACLQDSEERAVRMDAQLAELRERCRQQEHDAIQLQV